MGSLSSQAMQKIPLLAAVQRMKDEQNPQIAKNTILRDKVNDEQVALAKQGPMMIRNPKKVAKGA